APIAQDEIFGPAVAVSSAPDVTTAVELANSTDYGLAAGIFTNDVDAGVQYMREVDAGNIHINWTPLWRADLMPYGGLKASGIGKQGLRAAVGQMTEAKTIVIHGRPWSCGAVTDSTVAGPGGPAAQPGSTDSASMITRSRRSTPVRRRTHEPRTDHQTDGGPGRRQVPEQPVLRPRRRPSAIHSGRGRDLRPRQCGRLQPGVLAVRRRDPVHPGP